MHALAEAGLKIPGDVAIIGFDDIPASSHSNPPLTTLMQDIRGAGDVLLDVLMQSIDGGAMQGRELPAKLIIRESTVGWNDISSDNGA